MPRGGEEGRGRRERGRVRRRDGCTVFAPSVARAGRAREQGARASVPSGTRPRLGPLRLPEQVSSYHAWRFWRDGRRKKRDLSSLSRANSLLRQMGERGGRRCRARASQLGRVDGRAAATDAQERKAEAAVCCVACFGRGVGLPNAVCGWLRGRDGVEGRASRAAQCAGRPLREQRDLP